MTSRCVLLSGGIGGAKLAFGLDRIMPRGALTVIANTGDDFVHLGLSISPDLDTLMYTLAGIVNTETGWGRRGETWSFMAALEQIGAETWFRLGDLDLATHVERTRRLRTGQPLSAVTREFCERHDLGSKLLPMADGEVRTMVATDEGELPFQEYFVRRRAAPQVRAIRYAGAAQATPPEDALAALGDPQLAAIVIAPSNPFLSIDPILAIPALREALRAARAPVIAVSPIVGGKAIKGPTAKIMTELGLAVSPVAVARHYGDLLHGFILDDEDAELAGAIRRPGLAVATTQTVMASAGDKTALARFTLDFALSLPTG